MKLHRRDLFRTLLAAPAIAALPHPAPAVKPVPREKPARLPNWVRVEHWISADGLRLAWIRATPPWPAAPHEAGYVLMARRADGSIAYLGCGRLDVEVSVLEPAYPTTWDLAIQALDAHGRVIPGLDFWTRVPMGIERPRLHRLA